MHGQQDFEAGSAAFIEWFSETAESANISPKIAFADLRDTGAGRGVVAVADIDIDETLFQVPRCAVLSVHNSNLSDELPQTSLDELGPWLSLVLVLIREYQLGKVSRWSSYLSILPRTFDTLMAWSDEELVELQASAISKRVGRAQAEEDFRLRLIPLLRRHPALFFPPNAREANAQASDEALVELAHRMASLIQIAAFDIESDENILHNCNDQTEMDSDDESSSLLVEDNDNAVENIVTPKGMVPLADMLNADAQRNNARLYYDRETLTMRTTRPVRSGDEILNDYGELPRSELLRRYGYVTDNYAQYDTVEISEGLVVDIGKQRIGISDEDVELRLDYLAKQDVREPDYELRRASADSDAPTADAIPHGLIMLLNILCLSDENLANLVRRDKLPSRSLNAESRVLFREILSAVEAEYATSLEEDMRLLQDAQLSRRCRMAIAVRAGEKEILRNILMYSSESTDAKHRLPGDRQSSDASNKRQKTGTMFTT